MAFSVRECTKYHGYVSEAAQTANMTIRQGQHQKVPIPDPPHVLKLLRSLLFNYWTFVGNYLIGLKLLSSAREDKDEDISQPITKELPLRIK